MPAEEPLAPEAFEPETAEASRQTVQALLTAIQSLPPRCREAFMLYKFDGLSYAQIAAQMSISTRTVEMQLQIAMEACWRCQDRLDGMQPPLRERKRSKRAQP